MLRKIALEEHFMTPGFEGYSEAFTSLMSDTELKTLSEKLNDFDGQRIEIMNQAGIDMMILSQTGPGVQAEPDQTLAVDKARQSNDFLALQIERNPSRYSGFAALPMQRPQEAVNELLRCVNELGFRGALVNGHTLGQYYDDPAYDVVWKALQALNVPLYLHPPAFAGHPELAGAIWGWGVETGTHALRLLFGGVFDRFPDLKVILGHMGEGLPFQRWRFDSRFAVYSHGIRLQRQPSDYIGTNIVITTSGVCSGAVLVAAVEEMGEDAVMFSVDYPYESAVLANEFIEAAPLPEPVKQKICKGNAQRLFRL
jgi:2,3-dihydroxybenzoate decarboxylase